MKNREHLSNSDLPLPIGAVLVLGGGISGMQSALDLAHSGQKVYLVESSPAIGGKMAQLDKTFPTNDCSMCIVSPKLVEVGRHENIELLTHSELLSLDGAAGNFTATVVQHARYVDLNKCTGCGLCELACPVTHRSYFPLKTDEDTTTKKLRSKKKRTIEAATKITPTTIGAWQFSVNEEKCSKCGACHRACLHDAVSWRKKEYATINQDKCTGCGACLVACPDKYQAITVSAAPELEKSIGAAVHERSMLLRQQLKNRENNDCVRCGLCAITCKHVMQIGALKMVERGIEASVDICQVCGACVTTCPVDFLSIEQVSDRPPRPLFDVFNENLALRKPVNIHYPQAVPRVPVIDDASCVRLGSGACGTCATVCGVGAIDYGTVENTRKIEVGSVIFSPGIETFDAQLRGEYGYGNAKNVVTSIEFERLLSASGPTSGTVIRPSDGTHPKKIAWIQCVGSRDATCNRDYCSSVCCMYAVKEAFIAKEHDSSIEPTIFFIDMRSFGKNFDDYVIRAQEKDIRLVRAMVSRVYEDPVSGDLELRYVDESGRKISEEFAMVVLSVGIQVPQKTKELASSIGINIDRFGFAVTPHFSPLNSSRPGVFVSGAINGPKDIPETVSEASGAAQAAAVNLAAVRDSLTTRVVLPEERVIEPDEELRIGVFICHCGTNIASVVDVDAVTEYAKTLPGVVYAEHPLYTCSQDTQERIGEIIKKHRLNRVVASACSPTTHEPLFMSTLRQSGINKYFFDMANIRDQCSWVHPTCPEEATAKSKRLTQMAVANVTNGEALQEFEFEVEPNLLIIGGGLAGMTAAEEAAKQGFSVYLVEEQPQLGGQSRTLERTWDGVSFPDFLLQLERRVRANERIKIFTNSMVVDHSGFVGSFETEVMTPSGATRRLKHGAILVATGASEYRPDLYCLGKNRRVISQCDFETLLEGEKDETLSHGHIVMMQCAGSRDEDYLPYCSRVCCNQAVKNALAARKRYPELRIDILYRDIRCYGLGELYYQRSRKEGINFIRYDPKTNIPDIQIDDENIVITVIDRSIQLPVLLQPDLFILSTGIQPSETEELASMLRIPRNSNGFFIEAHAKLRPVDLPSEGLFMAGTAHGPKDSSETISQAQAAVARATTILAREKLQMSGVVSKVDPANCAVCLTCVRACPYGVPFINENHAAEINPALCQGCGICVAECPAKTISLGRFEDKNIAAKLSAYHDYKHAEAKGVG